MNTGDLLKLPFRYQPWRPLHLRLIYQDLARQSEQPPLDHQTHLTAAIDWLCRAQDIREGQPDAGGISAGWSFEDGWLPSYPETSGYIVETFIAAADSLNRPDLLKRAHRIIDWELSIQNDDGSFPGHFGEPGSRPVIFNTGQIVHGMLAGFLHLKREECLEAAVRAGEWLIKQQDPDGCWRRHVHNNIPHTYNTRAAWALLRAGIVAGHKNLRQAALRNLDWALTQQMENGWFANNAFTLDKAPFTHTIAYAIRGLLESGWLVQNEIYIQAARKAAHALAERQRQDGGLAGTFDENWTPKATYCCLTGLAQMSIIWLRLLQICNEKQLHLSVERALSFLKKTQRLTDSNDRIHGAIAGSSPIWGRYSMFEFPNWAAKFFADALMMDMKKIAIPSLPELTVESDSVRYV